MAFDKGYYIRAEVEIKNRRRINERTVTSRWNEISETYPEVVKLRGIIASAGTKLADLVMSRGMGIPTPDLNKDDVAEKINEIRRENVIANARIKELLMKKGYPADYLDPKYTCKECMDTGIIGKRHCDCFMRAVRRLASEDINSTSPLSLVNFESFDINYYPDEKDGISVRLMMKDNLGCCKKYAEDFHLPNGGLILMGKTGLGKTHLSLAIADTVMTNGFDVIYGCAPDLFRKIENEHFGKEKSNTMDALQGCDLLIIDDLGTEFETKFYKSQLMALFNSRLNSGRPTVINTNLDTREIKQRYGDMIASRIMTLKILKFYGNDIRQLKNAER